MNRRITIVEIARMMAQSTSTTHRLCELFLRELFTTVSQSLIDGESVKIKGVGTFKVVEVKPRKSVNVSSGKHIEIKSYKKVTFTPVKALAETVNQPFAQFETVLLNDDVSDDRLAEIDKQYPSLFNDEELLSEPKTTEPDQSVSPEPAPVPEPEPVPEQESAPSIEVVDEPVGRKALEVFGVPVEPVQEDPKPVHVTEPLMGIPIDGPSQPEPELSEPDPKPAPEPEDENDDYFYRPAPRNIFTPTQEQISRQQSRMKGRRVWLWLMPALVGVALLCWALTRCGGKAERQQETAVAVAVADSDSVAATVVQEPDVITDTVTSQIVLSTLSDRYYGSPWFWVYIYEENRAIISDPNNVRPGTEVVIPPAEKYGIDASDPASLKKAQLRSWEILKGK